MGASAGSYCGQELKGVFASCYGNGITPEPGLGDAPCLRMLQSEVNEESVWETNCCGAALPSPKYVRLHSSTEESMTTPPGVVGFFFEGSNAVPRDWKQTHEIVPEAFLFGGGSACVIRPEDPDDSSRHVLLVLDETAVDYERTKWLAKVQPSQQAHQCCCPLLHVLYSRPTGCMIFRFDYPLGESIKERMCRTGCLPEGMACLLLKDLMTLLVRLERSPFRMWGLLDDTMVFLDESGRLSNLLPMGCLLSSRKALRVAQDMYTAHNDVVPDLLTMREGKNIFAMDSYAIASVVLKAATSQSPRILQTRDIDRLSEASRDCLQKATYPEPEWRLIGRRVLQHPWLARA